MGSLLGARVNPLRLTLPLLSGIAVVGENVDVVQDVSVVVDHPDILAVLDADKEHVMGDIVVDCLWILDDRRQQDVPDNLRAAAVDLDDLGMSDVGAVGDVQVAVDRVERDILGIVAAKGFGRELTRV